MDVHPVDVIVSADGVGDRVEAVSDETVDSLDAGGCEGVDELFGDGGCHEVAVRGCGVSAGCWTSGVRARFRASKRSRSHAVADFRAPTS
jgi:hypothetical protein